MALWLYVARRLAVLVPTLFFVSVLIFSLQQLLPGDPALVMAGEERDPAVIEQIRHQYRLDQPIPVQYVYWAKGVLSGDLGESLRIVFDFFPRLPEGLPDLIRRLLPYIGLKEHLQSQFARFAASSHGSSQQSALSSQPSPVR